MKTKQELGRYLSFSLAGVSLVFIFIVLVIPNRISWITLSSFGYFPLEVLLLGLVLLVPWHAGVILRWVAAALLAVGIICKIADMAAYKVFARPFNPVFDAYLLADGMNLLKGTLGQAGALLFAFLLILLVLVIIGVVFLVLGAIRGLLLESPRVSGIALLSGIMLWSALWLFGWQRASTHFYSELATRTISTLNSLADIKSFRAVVNQDTYAEAPADRLFSRLRGKDVLVIFIESYGRTLLDNPEFSVHLRPLLEKNTATLAAAGFHTRSSYLTSPTVGGISWLAHGTALSGLWIDSQNRYDSLMMSKRPTLNRLFRNAGWRSVAVMPAITMAWPEGQYYGYDHIYAANNLGYQGKPFNWITMPDQYTLSAFQQFERIAAQRTPVMAEIALISSHAPWTPVPQLIDWKEVGDGIAFNEQATSGDAPEIVWKNNQRIRDQYRQSIEYVLATLVSYLLEYDNDNLVVLVMGDHQPAPLVTGDSDNRDVPVHLIARDVQVIDAVDNWMWTDGMLPADNAPVWRMDEIRNRFIETFSEFTLDVAISTQASFDGGSASKSR